MHMGNVLKVGSQSLFVMLFTLSGAFYNSIFISRLLKIDNITSIFDWCRYIHFAEARLLQPLHQ